METHKKVFIVIGRCFNRKDKTDLFGSMYPLVTTPRFEAMERFIVRVGPNATCSSAHGNPDFRLLHHSNCIGPAKHFFSIRWKAKHNIVSRIVYRSFWQHGRAPLVVPSIDQPRYHLVITTTCIQWVIANGKKYISVPSGLVHGCLLIVVCIELSQNLYGNTKRTKRRSGALGKLNLFQRCY